MLLKLGQFYVPETSIQKIDLNSRVQQKDGQFIDGGVTVHLLSPSGHTLGFLGDEADAIRSYLAKAGVSADATVPAHHAKPATVTK